MLQQPLQWLPRSHRCSSRRNHRELPVVAARREGRAAIGRVLHATQSRASVAAAQLFARQPIAFIAASAMSNLRINIVAVLPRSMQGALEVRASKHDTVRHLRDEALAQMGLTKDVPCDLVNPETNELITQLDQTLSEAGVCVRHWPPPRARLTRVWRRTVVPGVRGCQGASLVGIQGARRRPCVARRSHPRAAAGTRARSLARGSTQSRLGGGAERRGSAAGAGVRHGQRSSGQQQHAAGHRRVPLAWQAGGRWWRQ